MSAGERPARTLISVGSNIGPRRNLPAALLRLAPRLRILALSRVYVTEPVGATDGPTFLNAALLAETPLAPLALKHEVLRRVERELGRERGADADAPRTLDLDIALYGDLVLRDPAQGLEIPDPDILRRAHVAVPLADVAPDLVHPLTGETLAEIAARLGPLESLDDLPGWTLP